MPTSGTGFAAARAGRRAKTDDFIFGAGGETLSSHNSRIRGTQKEKQEEKKSGKNTNRIWSTETIAKRKMR
jgi:hypothetical protein